MAATKPVRGGDDYTTSVFDIKAYLKDVWSGEALGNNPLTVDILQDLHKAFQAVEVGGGSQLDFGCGPTIMSVLSSSKQCSHIVMSEYSAQFREEVTRWRHSDAEAHDWQPLMEYVAKCEGSGTTWEDVNKRVRDSIKELIPCDILQDPPLSPSPERPALFDVITSSLCLEAACLDKASYTDAHKRLARLLKDGGTLVLCGVLNQSVYDVGKETFYSLHLSKEDIDEALAQAGYEPATWYLHQVTGDFQYYHDAAGWFVLSARKKTTPPK